MGFSVRILVLICLAAWVSVTAIRLESLNAKAGNFLPRQDAEGGKWRAVFPPSTQVEYAQNQLRSLVGSIGILQYPLTLAACLLAFVEIENRISVRRSLFAVACGLAAVTALVIAIYRGYLTSLGW